MNRRFLLLLVATIIALIASLSCLTLQKCLRVEAKHGKKELTIALKSDIFDQNTSLGDAGKLDSDMGPGWHGEDLKAGFKLVNGVRSTTYDYDRGLAKRDKVWPWGTEMARAESSGADFKLSFRVQDENRQPVENASVVIGAFQKGPSRSFEGKTDSNGIATVSGFGTGELLVTIVKDSYYLTSFRHLFFNPQFECADNGRWLPWNPLLPVTIVKKGIGEVAFGYEAHFKLPDDECEISLDLIRGELASANSNENPAACVLRFIHQGFDENDGSKVLTLFMDFIGDGSGGIVVKQNRFCALHWPAIAPENGYESQLRFAWCRANVSCRFPRMLEDDMVVFRLRAKDGSYRYGIISQPLSETGEGRFIRTTVYVNGDHPDSRNLEPIPELKFVKKRFRFGAKEKE